MYIPLIKTSRDDERKHFQVIIFELPNDFNIPEILLVISDTINKHVPSINFIKIKYKLKHEISFF